MSWPSLTVSAGGFLPPTYPKAVSTSSLSSKRRAGLEKDEIDVAVDDRQVTITGQKRLESERREGSLVVRERAFGRFQRVIPMPAAVTAEGAEASYRRGVLKISVPKAVSAGGRSITVQKG